MIERWRDVIGYEGQYQVSDHGRVRSLDRIITWKGRPARRAGKILTPRNSGSGFQVEITRRNNRYVHDLVLEAFVGPCPPGKEGCHWDGDPANNYPTNLRWDTHAANIADMMRHGRHHQANKTCCPRDHLLIAPNLVPSSDGRSCLACSRTWGMMRTHPEINFQQESDRRYALIMS